MKKHVGAVTALLAVGLLTVGFVTPALAASQRQNEWLEVWCDSDTHNADGATIELKALADGTTLAGSDDARAKVVDASTHDPGQKDSSHFNRVAGVVQGWFCGGLRYEDGTIVCPPELVYTTRTDGGIACQDPNLS
jgi:hypothetical protein